MRKADKNPKARERLFDAAHELMLKKGYEATTVEKICQAAKLTKGSFFHYFEGKEDLVVKLLERFCCHSHEMRMESCCCGREADPLKRVYAHIDFVIEMSKDPQMGRGCLLGTLAQELSDTYPKIRELCDEGFAQWAKMLEKDLSQAKIKYAPRANFNSKSLAEHFIVVLEGSQLLAKVKKDRKVMVNNMEHFRDYLKSLFQKRRGGTK